MCIRDRFLVVAEDAEGNNRNIEIMALKGLVDNSRVGGEVERIEVDNPDAARAGGFDLCLGLLGVAGAGGGWRG